MPDSAALDTPTFTIGGTYLVTVIATDAAGSTSFAQRAVTITTLTIPTSVSVTSSPATPIAGQATTFTATATPTANHRIVSYQFVWGDGSSDTTASPIIQHTYSSGGSFLLTLTVKDDQGQTTTINKVLSVSSGLVAFFETRIVGAERQTLRSRRSSLPLSTQPPPFALSQTPEPPKQT